MVTLEEHVRVMIEDVAPWDIPDFGPTYRLSAGDVCGAANYLAALLDNWRNHKDPVANAIACLRHRYQAPELDGTSSEAARILFAIQALELVQADAGEDR